MVAAAGYHEPSLVFLAGTETRLTDGSDAADFLRAGQLPLRVGRVAAGAQLPAARRGDRAALRAAAAHRGLSTIAPGKAISIASIAPRARRERSRRHPASRAGGARRGCGSRRRMRAARSQRCCARRAGPAAAARPSARRLGARRARGRRRSSRPWSCSMPGRSAQCAPAARAWLVAAFNRITDFGQSGWFLWPTRAVADRARGRSIRRRCRGSRATCWRRCAVRLGFVFTAIARARACS